MLDLKNGVITLCQSGFKIDKNLTIDKLETAEGVQLIKKNDVKTGYVWYSIWADVEENEYIQISICFFVKNGRSSLDRVNVYPHIQKDNPIDAKTYFHNIERVSEYVKMWFDKYCDVPQKKFLWGKVLNIAGTPNVDPSVVFIYNR